MTLADMLATALSGGGAIKKVIRRTGGGGGGCGKRVFNIYANEN